MKEKIRYIYNAKYKSELGVCNFEIFRNYDHVLTEVEKRKELYNFNNMLKEKYNAEVIIVSHLYKQGEEKPFMNNLVEIDLNKLKSYNLENTLVDQLISVINEMSEFEVVSEFDEETELINREELIENREQIIKSGLKVISELYKFFVKLGFSNEEINEWISEVNGN